MKHPSIARVRGLLTLLDKAGDLPTINILLRQIIIEVQTLERAYKKLVEADKVARGQ